MVRSPADDGNLTVLAHHPARSNLDRAVHGCIDQHGAVMMLLTGGKVVGTSTRTGPAATVNRGQQEESGKMGAEGLSWTLRDMIQNRHHSDQGHHIATDAKRTERRAYAARNGVSAGQWPLRWAGWPYCKTVGLADVGSNPTPATTCGNGP